MADQRQQELPRPPQAVMRTGAGAPHSVVRASQGWLASKRGRGAERARMHSMHVHSIMQNALCGLSGSKRRGAVLYRRIFLRQARDPEVLLAILASVESAADVCCERRGVQQRPSPPPSTSRDGGGARPVMEAGGNKGTTAARRPARKADSGGGRSAAVGCTRPPKLKECPGPLGATPLHEALAAAVPCQARAAGGGRGGAAAFLGLL